MTRRLFSSFLLNIRRNHFGRIALGIIATTSVVLALGIVQPVQAATFTCTGGDVHCLITSINQANGNGEANTIHLDDGTYTLTMPFGGPSGPTGLPEITSTLTILGGDAAAVIIERDATAPFSLILSVAANGDLTIQGVTLRNGRTAISNLGGAVRLVATILSDNGGGSFETGGAIFNQGGLVTITHSTLTGNGRAITTSNGTMYIAHSRITHNGTGLPGNFTGGLFQLGGFVDINGSTFDHNFEIGTGAIITTSNFFGTVGHPPATMVITDSAFIENVGSSVGAISIGATVSVTNTTFARNIIENFFGFPATSSAIANGGKLTLTNSTIADNIQAFAQLPIHAGLDTGVGATTILQNTILARNADPPFGRDCIGPITSLGNNLIGDLTGCSVVLQPTDLTGDAGLGAFTDNGTPGNGHIPLLPTSPAINAANDAVCPEKDQIGQPRKPHCDIGAVEFSHHHNPNDTNELVQNVP